MSDKVDLELDAILAEFHAEELKAPPKPVPAEKPLRRAEVPRPVQTQPPKPTPLPRQEPVKAAPAVAVAEKPAPARRASAPRRADVSELLEEKEITAREGRAARRERAGIVRMLLALAALAVLLAGLLAWAIHDEKQVVSEDTEILSLQLGEAMEDYLDEAPTRFRG